MPWAVSPAKAIEGVIDLEQSGGIKIHAKGSEKLQEEPYNLEAEGIFNVLESLEVRGNTYGWTSNSNGLFYIPEDPTADDLGAEDSTYFFDDYVEVEEEIIEAWEKRMYTDRVRGAQDSNMVFQALMNTLGADGKADVFLSKEEYEFTDEATGDVIQGGIALLKTIIGQATLDGPGMASIVRKDIANLKDYMIEIGSDVKKFNLHVKLLIKRLNRLGEESNEDDLMMHLFDSYLSVQDKKFVKYMEGRKEEHDDQRRTLSPKVLQGIALTRYKLQTKNRDWKAPTQTQRELHALEAKVNKFEAQVKKMKKKPTPSVDYADKNKPKSDEKKKGKPDWLLNNIKPKEIKEKRQSNGMDWWWCGKETGGKCDPPQWRAHDPKECRGMAGKGKSGKAKAFIHKTKRDDGTREGGSRPQLAMAQEARAILTSNGIDPDSIMDVESE